MSDCIYPKYRSNNNDNSQSNNNNNNDSTNNSQSIINELEKGGILIDSFETENDTENHLK